jgi:Tfp pilus assembly protein PilF
VRARRAILAAVAALALVGQTRRGAHVVESSVFVRAVQAQAAALQGARLPGPMWRAMDEALAVAHRLDPEAVEPLAFRADLLYMTGRLGDADAAYRVAARHEARTEVFFNWGLTLARAGRMEEAAIQLRRGIALGSQLSSRLEEQVPPAARPYLAAAPVVPIPPLEPVPASHAP